MSVHGLDPYAAVVDLVATVARAPESPERRLQSISDLLVDRLHSTTGLMVHGDRTGFEMRALGQGATPHSRRLIREGLRVTAGPDAFIDPFRRGDLEPTTAARRHGGQEAWLAHPKCIGSVEIWGINQVVGLPVRGGDGFIAFLVGRMGDDYDETDLALLRVIQPVVASLVDLVEPRELPEATLRIAHLTSREQEVLELLADGHKATTIGHLAGCSERTVHRHLANIYAKLEVTDRLSAVVTAQQMGLLHEHTGSRHG